MKKLLELDVRPDGVFCYNDPIAIGVVDAILEAGLRVPQDIAVIGCGNLHYDKSLRVPLSSIDQQSKVIGERAGKLVLSLMESKVPPPPKCIMLEPKLVARESTRRD
jgi:LacI family transcriptional regulator